MKQLAKYTLYKVETTDGGQKSSQLYAVSSMKELFKLLMDIDMELEVLSVDKEGDISVVLPETPTVLNTSSKNFNPHKIQQTPLNSIRALEML